MYQPIQFRVEDPAECHALIEAAPLGALVTAGAEGLEANHVPFVLHREEGPLGTLRCHLARANGQWRSVGEGAETLVLFQVADGYVTPGWYPSKAEHGKVVPTWNYVVVQARGKARLVEDDAWLQAHLEALTRQQEAVRDRPWAVGDAPDAFVAVQKRAIVGVEIALTGLAGKAKVSQNRQMADREAVFRALEGEHTPSAAIMARLLARHLQPA